MSEPRITPPTPGVNDLATLRPDVAALWHPTKNGDVSASDIMPGARRNMWWLGECGHEWFIAPRVMTRLRDTGYKPGCPVCKGRQVLIGFNDLASKNPAVAAEWHPHKNTSMSPDTITYSSAKIAWWYSDVCGHEWQDVICERTRERRAKGCKICNSMEAQTGVNDLATTHPEIAALWHPSKNKLTPQEVMAGARTKKYWWLGPCGHDWEAPPVRMSSKYRIGSGCPYCCGKKILIGFNDMATTQPELAKEWHSEKNGTLKPTDISQWDARSAWWQCIDYANHVWFSPVGSRSKGAGCPRCTAKTSKPEKALYEALLLKYQDAVNGEKISLRWGRMKVAELDIFLPSLNTVIEYDGWWWHKDKTKKDISKTQALLDAGYKVIRVRVSPLPFLDMKHENLRQVVANHGDDAKELADRITSMF